MGKGITRRRYGSGHPRSGSRARALYPPRWTLRENPSSQPGRDLARKYKTAQNFRNWWLRISGTHNLDAHASLILRQIRTRRDNQPVKTAPEERSTSITLSAIHEN